MTEHGVRRLDLFVTEACNLACDYCFAATRPRKNPSLEQMLEAIDWLMRSRAHKVHITFWGGEPLLRVELLRGAVEHAKQRAKENSKRVTFSMPTNASLIDADTMRWLEENDVQVFLSIDGDEAGQAGRPLKSGESSHPLVSRGMKRALKQAGRQPPAIRMTVSPDNARDQADGARYFIENGARELLIYAAIDQTWTDEALADFAYGQSQLAHLLVELVSGDGPPVAVPSFKAWRPILRRLFVDAPPRKREGPLAHCGAGSDLVALTVDGQLAPCHRYVFYGRDRGEDVAIGDLQSGLNDEKARHLTGLRIEHMRGETRCVDCNVFDLCTYGCVAVSYATTGAVDAIPATACTLMRAQIDACRDVHHRLRDDPRYALYLGQPLRSTVAAAAEKLGGRAWELYQSRTNGRRHHGEDRAVQS